MKAATLLATPRIDARPFGRASLGSKSKIRSADRRNLAGLLLIVPMATILSLPAWLAPSRIVFKDFGSTEVLHLLTMLFLGAMLAERALEIFVGTWRSPGATQLDLAVRTCERNLARLHTLPQPDDAAVADATATLEEAKRQQLEYRCVTRQVALWTGLALGLLVSGVGLRALETLIDPVLSGWSHQQSVAFRLVDVLLTGGVIAGGSEGIHRLATVFESFMATAATRAKG